MIFSANSELSKNAKLLLIKRELWRRRCRRELLAWSTEALAPYGQTPAAHHRLMIRELEDLAHGRNDRLMLLLPPGSAKSTYASVLFPAWFMQTPNQDVIGASHGATMAEDFSGRVQGMIAEHSETLGYGLKSQNVELWRTTNGCVYRAAGAGGSITGRRADLFIIDDPMKGREDADSPTIREKVWAWYRAEVLTRLKPGARIVLILTRWHEDDLAGRLLQEQERGADQWRVVSLPAIAESEDDPLGRDIGDALWPEWEDEKALARKRASVGEREWASLYQQRPRPVEGSLFQIGRIGILDAEPAGVRWVRAWDLAATRAMGTANADYTVGVKMGKMPDGRILIGDIMRLRGDPSEVEATIHGIAQQDGAACRISIPQDPGQAGVAQVQYLAKKLMGFRIESSRETGDKARRASPFAAQVNVGNVLMIRAGWNRPLTEELAAFPNGTHDDQVDACSRAFNMITARPGPMQISAAALHNAQGMPR